ncbi:MAG TPA: class I SAM-dependent methyltransferase [Gemmatimonadaceae bacterium]|nr:class I SAM-dependent methyltransferase [Gemmatimonadaceae bacterium]
MTDASSSRTAMGVAWLRAAHQLYDTFIAQQPTWARSLRIIEVDQPATQAEKRARLAAAGLQLPDNVQFATVARCPSI